MEFFCRIDILYCVLALSFIVMDPFGMSPVGSHNFRPVKNDIAPYGEVMESWKGDSQSRLGHGTLEFEDEDFGPESVEFDIWGLGPYAGLADGRVVRWMEDEVGTEMFSLVTCHWSENLSVKGVDPTSGKNWKAESKCGRPLSLRFDRESGNLFIADAYYGLLVVGREGGVATPLATEIDREPILFANDLDIHRNGSIFFTDMSKKYNSEPFRQLTGRRSERTAPYIRPSNQNNA